MELELLSSSFLCIYCLWKGVDYLSQSWLIWFIYIYFFFLVGSYLITWKTEVCLHSAFGFPCSTQHCLWFQTNVIYKKLLYPLFPHHLFFLSNLVLPWCPRSSLWQQLQVEGNFGGFSTDKIEGKKTKTSGSFFKFHNLFFSLWHITVCSSQHHLCH